MKVTETIERMTLDLMVKGGIDQKELRPSFNELSKALANAKEIGHLLKDLEKALDSPPDSSENNSKFQEMLQILGKIDSHVKEKRKSDKTDDIQIPDKLSFNTQTEAEVVESFQFETADLFEKLEHDLLLLERSPKSEEMITTVMGRLHSIKGIAGFLEFVAIQKLVHIAESALSIGLEKKLVSGQLCDVLLRTKDMCQDLVKMLSNHLKSKARKFPKLPSTYPLLFKELLELSRENSSAKSSASTSNRTKEIEVESDLAPSKSQDASNTNVVDDTKKRDDQPEIEYEEYTEEDLQNIFGNLIFEAEEVANEQLHADNDVLEKQTDIRPDPALEQQVHIFDSSDNVRIKLSKLETLLDLIGEMVIAHSQVTHDPALAGVHDVDLERKLEQLTKCTREIQALGMGLRVFPVRQLFAPLTRTVRDLAMKLKKDVEVIRQGEDAELDKSVLQALSDPLMHMVRNAVDHGIESKEERRKSGKKDKGRIILSAKNEGGMVHIEVEDNGRGLNRNKIIGKAKTMGLIKDGENLNDKAVWNLIFAPGFSTSATVSEVSGRGVGMDVVQKSIHRLGGRIYVDSAPGKKTKFTLILPLTLAMIEGLAVDVGRNSYIIPRSAVGEIIRPKHGQVNSVHGRGEMLSVRGQKMPLVRLHEFLKVKDYEKEPWNAVSLIIKNSALPFALMVDKVSGQQQIVLKGLGESLMNQKGISGCTILGDGRVGLVLNPGEIYTFVMNSTVHEVA